MTTTFTIRSELRARTEALAMTPLSPMTGLETIAALDGVIGGVQSGNAPEQRQERHRNLCELPSRAEAERQFRVMASWGDRGVWRRTVDAIGKECGWSVPPPAAR